MAGKEVKLSACSTLRIVNVPRADVRLNGCDFAGKGEFMACSEVLALTAIDICG